MDLVPGKHIWHTLLQTCAKRIEPQRHGPEPVLGMGVDMGGIGRTEKSRGAGKRGGRRVSAQEESNHGLAVPSFSVQLLCSLWAVGSVGWT